MRGTRCHNHNHFFQKLFAITLIRHSVQMAMHLSGVIVGSGLSIAVLPMPLEGGYQITITGIVAAPAQPLLNAQPMLNVFGLPLGAPIPSSGALRAMVVDGPIEPGAAARPAQKRRRFGEAGLVAPNLIIPLPNGPVRDPSLVTFRVKQYTGSYSPVAHVSRDCPSIRDKPYDDIYVKTETFARLRGMPRCQKYLCKNTALGAGI
jgi:hypothetical protein